MLPHTEASPCEYSSEQETPETDRPPLFHSGDRYCLWVREQYDNVEDPDVDSLNDNVLRLLIQFYGGSSLSHKEDFFALFDTLLDYAPYLGARFPLLTSLLENCISTQLSASLLAPLIRVEEDRDCDA